MRHHLQSRIQHTDSLIPRPHPAFRRFHYSKVERAWYLFTQLHAQRSLCNTCGKLPVTLALFSLFWVQCAHAQLNLFYHPFDPDITHVRKDTRPSPTLPYWKRRKESWVGLGNKTSIQICSTGWEFLYSITQ